MLMNITQRFLRNWTDRCLLINWFEYSLCTLLIRHAFAWRRFAIYDSAWYSDIDIEWCVIVEAPILPTVYQTQ